MGASASSCGCRPWCRVQHSFCQVRVCPSHDAGRDGARPFPVSVLRVFCFTFTLIISHSPPMQFLPLHPRYPGYNLMETPDQTTAHAMLVRTYLRNIADMAVRDVGVSVEKVSSCPSLAYAGCSGHTQGVKYTIELNHSSLAGNPSLAAVQLLWLRSSGLPAPALGPVFDGDDHRYHRLRLPTQRPRGCRVCQSWPLRPRHRVVLL